MVNSPVFPSANVLRAFEATAIPTLLPGGRQTAYRAGDIVLKPVDGVWEGANGSILNYVRDVKEIDQMLVRAEIRRLMEIDGHHRQSGKDTLAEVEAHLEIVELIYQRAAKS